MKGFNRHCWPYTMPPPCLPCTDLSTTFEVMIKTGGCVNTESAPLQWRWTSWWIGTVFIQCREKRKHVNLLMALFFIHNSFLRSKENVSHDNDGLSGGRPPWVCVCMYVCMFVFMCVCVCVCVFSNVCACV